MHRLHIIRFVGANAREGGGGGKCPRAITLKLFMVLKLNLVGKYLENHKLINLE